MIRSTFAGFTTAQLGMAASQRSLDVAGQNIANINTIGYTKQRLDESAERFYVQFQIQYQSRIWC